MTDLKQAATLALEALEWVYGGEPLPTKEREAIIALKAALEQQQAEFDCPRCGHVCSQRQWVGLTDEEITELRLKTFDSVATNYESYRAIEAKLKEKNDH